MSTILDRIYALYRRQGDLRRETAFRWLTSAEIDELTNIQTELHNRLWPARQAELAGASEAQRIKADAAIRGVKATNKGDGRRFA